MESVSAFLSQFGTLKEEEIEAFTSKLKKIELKKKDYLLHAGQTCRHLHFLEKGAIRAFYLSDGKEIVTWFKIDQGPLAPFYSFSTQKPGIENVQLVEDSILYAISYDDLEALYANYHSIEHFGRKITEELYRRLEDRLMSLQLFTAKQRYQKVIEENPNVLQKVSLGDLASYLGISQETLSRVRKPSTKM